MLRSERRNSMQILNISSKAFRRVSQSTCKKKRWCSRERASQNLEVIHSVHYIFSSLIVTQTRAPTRAAEGRTFASLTIQIPRQLSSQMYIQLCKANGRARPPPKARLPPNRESIFTLLCESVRTLKFVSPVGEA